MTPALSRRRASALPPGDLEELEPQHGLWRFAWLWLTRGDRPIEAEEAPPDPPPSEIAPSRKRRVTKREATAPDPAAWRARAWSWLARPAQGAGEARRRRVSKPPIAPLGLRARTWAWLMRSAPGALEAKRRRVSKPPSPPAAPLGFRARAWSWHVRPPTPTSEPKRRRAAKAPPPTLGARARAHAWLTRPSPIPARPGADRTPEPKRRRIPIAVLRAFRKRAHTWLNRPREVAPEVEVEAIPAIPAPPVPPTPGKRKRGPKVVSAPPPAPSPLDPVVVFRRRAHAWLDEGGATTPLTGVQHPGGEVARAHLRGVLEALVFASEQPLPAKELARLAKAELRLVKALLAELVLDYHSRGFRLDEVAGGYIFRTSPAFAPFVREQVAKKPVRMSRAQIETLAIVAYRQPITRPEVDDVRGVDSGAVLKSLLERDLVRILGKKDEPGRPMLYGTTSDFLQFFGLKTLSDLPTLREFTELTDESKRTYEREMGEEPPDDPSLEGGLMGGEGEFRKSGAATDGADGPPRPASDYEDDVDDGNTVNVGDTANAGDGVNVGDDVDQPIPTPEDPVDEERESADATTGGAVDEGRTSPDVEDAISGEARAIDDGDDDADEEDDDEDEDDDDEDDEDEDEDEDDDDEDDDEDE